MSVADQVVSVVLLAGVGVLVVGWLLAQLVGEVLYRVWERPLSSLRPPRRRAAAGDPAGVES